MGNLIAVTGATGVVGGRVARRLADLGVAQRLVVRDPARSPELPGAEVRAASAYGAGEDMRAALAGVATLFLVPAHESADRVMQHRTAVDAAVAAGVQRIVYLSFLGAAPDATFTLARDHWATEEHIRAAGVPFTFPRMGPYMDFVPLMAGSDGVIRGPAGEGRCAWVARDDVADVAAAVLAADGEHDGQIYDLTGPEAHTLTWAAEQLSAVSGRDIRFRNQGVQAAYESRAHIDAPDHELDGWVTSYVAIGTGEMDVVSDAVERIAGHPPIAFDDWLRANPEAWAHLRA
jgi:NAD(P)H dehydrogenase (quinone)